MIEINKRIINILGFLITIICFVFIGKMIINIDMDWNVVGNTMGKKILISFLALLLAMALYLVAYGWSIAVKFIEYKDINNSKLISIYIKSNIAKYLPGNIMNLVGRNVLAGNLGFKQISIVTSTVIEMILFAFTSMFLSVLFSITKLRAIYNIVNEYLNYKFISIVMIGGILSIILIALVLIRKKEKYIKSIKKYFTTGFLKVSTKLTLLYSIYFIFSGFMLVIILKYILNIDIGYNIMLSIVGCYIISFFIGYITPGAPGGMGVREAVLIILLTSIVDIDFATAAAIIHRIITIISDILLYCITYIYDKMKQF